MSFARMSTRSKVLAAFVTVVLAASTPLIIHLIIEYYTAPASHAATGVVAETLLVQLCAFALALILGLVVANAILSPMARLRKALLDLAGGDTGFDLADAARRDELGDLARALHMLRDRIARAKTDEQSLASAEKRWLFALEGTGQGVWDYDVVSGTTLVSRIWARHLGHDCDHMLLTSPEWRALIHPHDLPVLDEALAVHLAGRTEFYEWEGRMRHADGHWVWILDRGRVAEVNPDGSPRRMIGASIDRTEHYNTVEALRDIEARWNFALEGAGQGVWDYDSERPLTYVSDLWARIMGYEVHEVDRTHDGWKSHLHPDDMHIPLQAIDEHLAGKTPYFSSEYRVRHKDGRWIWILDRGRVITRHPDGRVRRVIGARVDITGRKQMETTLRRREASLKLAVDSAELGIWEVDANTDSFTFSDLFLEQLGLNRDNFDFTGEGLKARIHPDDAAASCRAIEDLWANKAEFLHLEHRMRHGNGEWRWMQTRGRVVERNPDGSVKHIIGTHLDVTRRRELLEGVRLLEERWAFALDNAGQGVWDQDFINGRAYFSSAWLNMLGLEREDLSEVGSEWMTRMHPDDVEAYKAADAAHLAGLTPSFVGKFRLRHKDGHWVWILDRGKVIARDEHGQPTRMVGTHEDISELVAIEAELREARLRAEAAAQAKSDFLSNMTHELRTPLTGILGAIDLMLSENGGLPPHLVEIIEVQRQAGRSLLQIINDILDFSKVENGQLSLENVPVSPGEVMAGCSAILSSQIRARGLRFTQTCAAGVPEQILGDGGRLRQILLNFLSNAVKFTPDGGSVGFACHMTETGQLRFDVSDTGVGIAPDRIAMLFDRFTQADSSISRRYGGTGLGLAISKRLVDLMGGEILVESMPGRGTTFSLLLPCVPVAAPREDSTGTVPDVLPSRPHRILVAEDNALNRLLFERMLSRRGFDVVTAEDGGAVLQKLAEPGEAGIELVLMDLQMPGMDGLEATRRLRANPATRTLPIIALSANTEQKDIDACFEAGMDDYLSKPVNWNLLVERIEAALGLRDAA